jgi:ABC-type branched-subunit amino acid transport system ATPase component
MAGPPDAGSDPGRSLLDVRGLVVRRNGTVVVGGVSFCLQAGETAAVVGQQGSGKTTMIEALCGVIRLERGQVWLAGREITGWHTADVVRAGVSATFARPRLAGSLTVRENLEAAIAGRARRPRSPALPTVTEVLDELWLDGCRHRLAHLLAPGEARRVEIARALLTGSLLLLLDEPFGGLGHDETAEVLSTLRHLRRRGQSMLIAARRLGVEDTLCSLVLRLDGGHLTTAPVPRISRA